MRRLYYLKPNIQNSFTSVFTFITAIEILIFTAVIFITESYSKQIPVDFWIYYRFGYVLLSLLIFSAFNFWYGTRLSHKIAGPLIQIQRALDSAIKGNYKFRIRLRSGDLLHEVEEKLNALLEELESTPRKKNELNNKKNEKNVNRSKLLFEQEKE